MTILFICYWSADDNLTIATVLPRLQILQESPHVQKVIFLTVERSKITVNTPNYLTNLSKVFHSPFQSGKYNGSILEKVIDFLQLPAYLLRLVNENRVTTVLAHGAPAGALAYKLWTKIRLPFYISSFEPHAAYMVESGVWKQGSLKYKLQAKWERKQQKFASGIMPVSEGFTRLLLEKGVPNARLFTVPCSVDAAKFSFNVPARNEIREKYSWQKYTIGIYAGKFGGLYYDEEAFLIFRKCFGMIPDFFLILLSPDDLTSIRHKLIKQQIDLSKVYLDSVPHEKVAEFLSTADFAFAPYKPGPSKKYLSPIKIGEYWANGLPVLLTEGVGDDSDIIQNEGGGGLFNLQQEGSLEKAISQIQEILKDKSHRQQIPELAKKYRSPDRLQKAYTYFFSKGEHQS